MHKDKTFMKVVENIIILCFFLPNNTFLSVSRPSQFMTISIGETMGEKMKLKVKALRILQADLHPDEMMAIYLMEFGTEMPPNLTKQLTKIVRLLCQKLNWVDDGCDPQGLATNSIFNVLAYIVTKNQCFAWRANK